MNRWDDVEIFCACLLVVAFLCFGGAIYLNDKEAFSAWVKLTENPKEITFKEWRSMKRAGIIKDGGK